MKKGYIPTCDNLDLKKAEELSFKLSSYTYRISVSSIFMEIKTQIDDIKRELNNEINFITVSI